MQSSQNTVYRRFPQFNVLSHISDCTRQTFKHCELVQEMYIGVHDAGIPCSESSFWVTHSTLWSKNHNHHRGEFDRPRPNVESCSSRGPGTASTHPPTEHMPGSTTAAFRDHPECCASQFQSTTRKNVEWIEFSLWMDSHRCKGSTWKQKSIPSERWTLSD